MASGRLQQRGESTAGRSIVSYSLDIISLDGEVNSPPAADRLVSCGVDTVGAADPAGKEPPPVPPPEPPPVDCGVEVAEDT